MKKNITIIFLANFFSLLSGVMTSLLTAWALGPEGRGDLAIVVLYPNVVALIVGLGLAQAHRYLLACEPEIASPLFSNALIFAAAMGVLAFVAAEMIVPNLVGERSQDVMWLVRTYLINIPLALLYDLMAGMLEGSRQFKWAALSRILFFGIQSVMYLVLWLTGHLTVFSATVTMIFAQVANTLMATFSVSRVLRPRWQPSWAEWKKTIGYGLKNHIGSVTSFTTLRLDQLMLGGMATSVEIGLYVIAVRLSEITTVLASSVSEVLMPEVAASKKPDDSIRLLTRSLRQMIYIYLLLIIPLMLGETLILEYVFGAEFLAAAGTLRLLLLASMIWSAGAIIISGLNGFGYPGLSTLARISAAVVTVFSLLYLLPRYGISGAALSSLIGYSVMTGAALFWLLRKKNISLGELFRPQKDDLPMNKLTSLFKTKFNSATETTDSATAQKNGFHQFFEKQAAAHPEQTAVISKGNRLTYGELNARANQLARHLREHGAKPEMLIPICTDRSEAMAIGILGILKSGAAFVPVDPSYPSERVEFMLADTNAPFIVTQSDLLPSAKAAKILLDSNWETISQNSTENLPSTADADNLAYVIYTSGSTGKPKGAMLTHANLSHYVGALQAEFGLTAEDKYLHLASIGFSSSRRHLLFPLAYGATVVVADEAQRMDPLPLFDLIKKEAVTIFDAVPSFQRHCLNALRELAPERRNELLNNNLRLIVSASEPLLSDVPAAWMNEFKHRAQHVHMLGQTETSGIIALNRITAEDVTGAIRPVPIGRPIQNTKIYLLDENQNLVEPGEAGEIYVCGDGLGRGYLNRPELNQEKFVELSLPDSETENPNVRRFCRTGDFARRLADGRLECLGRQDFQVKVRGFRVELGEIEALFISHPNVRECAVVGREDVPGQIRLAAYVAARDKSETLIEELRRLAKEKLPDYMQPAAYVAVDALPLTPNGKVDRKNLPASDESAFQNEKTYTAARNGIEQTIADIWRKVLNFNRIGVHDNFFDLGGHSLLAGQIISRLRAAFQIEIPFRTIFESPTIAELAEKIESLRQQTVFSSAPALIKTEKSATIPLAFSQQRLWFLAQMEQNSSAYNMTETVRLSGKLDADALKSALDETIARHEILRTSFQSIGGKPFQVIADEAKIDLSVTDLTAFSDEARENEWRQIADEFSYAPFDLTAPPLLRLKLIKLAENEHVLVIVFHHIVSDGWSVGVFLKELSAIYQAKVSGGDVSLPELSIQFADYAAWQQKWLETEEYRRQLEFWKTQLADAPALLELPTDFPRPARQRFQGAQLSTFLPTDLTEKINRLGRAAGATTFITLLSAWQLLLARYSNQDQIVVGTPIAGRTAAETENLIGFFVNTLALRADLSNNPTFREFLGRNKARALAAYANQELPFEKLVEEVNPERSLSYAPIFQVMFALQNAPAAGANFADLKLSYEQTDAKTAKFDLSLDVYEEADGRLELKLEYDTDLFAAETAEQILNNFRTILESIVAEPELRLSEAPLLSAPQRRQMLVDWNSRQTEIPPVCLHQLFEERAAETPGAIAVVWNEERISYADLNRKANKLAHFLSKRGVKPETVVGIYAERSPEMVVAVLAVLKAGAAYLPLDANYPAERLQQMVSEAGVCLLVTQENLKSKAAELGAPETVCLNGNRAEIEGEPAENPACAAMPENLAYVIFTSGSTGKAKGAMIEHRHIVNAFVAWNDAYQASSLGSYLQMASFSFDVFTADLTRALCGGGTLVLCPSDLLLEPARLYALLQSEKIEFGDFVPAVARPLIEYLENTGKHLDFLKVIVVGSDIWQMEEYRRLRRLCGGKTRIVNSYGITETAVDSAFFEPSEKDEQISGVLPIGRPFANTQLFILDEQRNPVPARVAGELYIGGSGVGRGYINRPELTAEKFVEWTNAPAELAAEKPRLYKTGDLARYRHDGTIEILGRADYQIKLRGFRIELAEIEAAVSKHPDVGESIVALREDQPGEKRLVAYLTTKSNQTDAGELRRFVKSFLPEYMVPAAFVLMKEWRLTPNGKIDRKALPPPDETVAKTEKIPASNQVEEKLVGIWAELLRCEKIGVNENFFDLGGHSLLAAQAVSRARDAFGIEVSVRDLFEAPTIVELAVRIVNLGDLSAPDETNGKHDDELERLLAELENVSEEEAQKLVETMCG